MVDKVAKQTEVQKVNVKPRRCERNLFVIELDETKINPYYLQAFLSNDLGVAIFKNIYTGGAIPTITLDKLKKMIILFPPLEEQMDIANKYAATIDELVMLNRKSKK